MELILRAELERQQQQEQQQEADAQQQLHQLQSLQQQQLERKGGRSTVMEQPEVMKRLISEDSLLQVLIQCVIGVVD